MKRFYYILLTLLPAFMACAEREFDFVPEEIGFKAVTRNATKANVFGTIGTAYNDVEHFGVYAFHEVSADSWASAPYMNNVEIEKDTLDGLWRNLEKKYFWPSEGKLTFACYSPYVFEGTVSASQETGITVTGYLASANVKQQIDLMASDLITGYDNNVSPVPVTFRHLLSQIKFKAQSNFNYSAGTNVSSITIDSLIIDGLNTKADYATTDGRRENGAWSNLSEPKEYCVLDSAVQLVLDGKSPVDVGIPILPIPQDISQSNSVKIVYTITFDNGSKSTDTRYFSTVNEWQIGFIYTYTIKIGLNEISFVPNVEKWDLANNVDVEI